MVGMGSRPVSAMRPANTEMFEGAPPLDVMLSEEAHRLLLDIHDATRGLSDPAMVMREIVTRVGLHFNVTRCAFGEVDLESNVIEITRGYTDGVPTVAGRYPFEVFGPLLVAELMVGRTVAVSDVSTDPLTATPAAQEIYAQMQIASLVCVPLLRRQRLVAVLVVCDGRPRDWTRPKIWSNSSSLTRKA